MLLQLNKFQLKNEGYIHCVWADKHETMSELIRNKHITDRFRQ